MHIFPSPWDQSVDLCQEVWFISLCSTSASYQSISDYKCKHGTKYLATTVMQLRIQLFSFSCHFNIKKYLHLVNTCGFQKKRHGQNESRDDLFIWFHFDTHKLIRLALAMLEEKQKGRSLQEWKWKDTSMAFGFKGMLFITSSLFHTHNSLFERKMAKLMQTEFNHSTMLTAVKTNIYIRKYSYCSPSTFYSNTILYSPNACFIVVLSEVYHKSWWKAVCVCLRWMITHSGFEYSAILNSPSWLR